MANVKHKENGEWVKIGEAPLSTPIDITRYIQIPLPETILPGNSVVYGNNACYNCYEKSRTGNWQDTGISVTIHIPGTYRFTWGMEADDPSIITRLYKNGSPVGQEHQAPSGSDITLSTLTEDIVCSAGDVIAVWIKPEVYTYWGSTYYYGCAGNLKASISWPELEALLQ